jgi:hypothetical protein
MRYVADSAPRESMTSWLYAPSTAIETLAPSAPSLSHEAPGADAWTSATASPAAVAVKVRLNNDCAEAVAANHITNAHASAARRFDMEIAFIENPARLSIMTAQQKSERTPWWTVVLRDEHFWIPLAVLVAGLVILRWIA